MVISGGNVNVHNIFHISLAISLKYVDHRHTKQAQMDINDQKMYLVV